MWRGIEVTLTYPDPSCFDLELSQLDRKKPQNLQQEPHSPDLTRHT